MMDRIMESPVWVALFGAHFVPYALVAFGVIGIRAFGRKLRGREWLFLLLVGLLFAVEGVQLLVTDNKVADGNLRMAVNRYFGVLAPFLWIFAAKGVSYVWGHSRKLVRRTGRVIVVLALAWVFLAPNVAMLVSYQVAGTAGDTAVAVANVVPVIRADYQGPAKQPEIKRSLLEYYTGRRPLISSPYAAAGWAVRGDACGATGAACPYQEDYLFLPLGGNYNDIKEVDSKVFTFVAHVRGGHGTTWALFRRRTTPGRTELEKKR